MVSVVQNVAIDCSDAYRPARFWSEVTGCPLHPQDRQGDPETQVMLPEGPLLYFNQVPEPKTIKNRIAQRVRSCCDVFLNFGTLRPRAPMATGHSRSLSTATRPRLHT